MEDEKQTCLDLIMYQFPESNRKGLALHYLKLGKNRRSDIYEL